MVIWFNSFLQRFKNEWFLLPAGRMVSVGIVYLGKPLFATVLLLWLIVYQILLINGNSDEVTINPFFWLVPTAVVSYALLNTPGCYRMAFSGQIENKHPVIVRPNSPGQSFGRNFMSHLSVPVAQVLPLVDASLSPIQVKQIQRLVLKFVIEERRFLQQRYSLKALSEDSGIPVYLLSLFMNKHCRICYSDFINKLRIEYCKEKILTGECGLKTLEALGMESGFNNRTTFTQCFKKFTGYTPSAFLQQTQSDALLDKSRFAISLPEGSVLTAALP